MKYETDLIKLNSNGVTKILLWKKVAEIPQLKIDVLRKFALEYSFSISVIENLEKYLQWS